MKYIYCLIFLLLGFSIKSQYSDSISINFFLLDECRITQNMSGEINYIFQNYNSSPFSQICYFPNFSSKPEKIKKFMSDYKIDIPYKTDYYKTKTKKYGATIAPEVVVYDEKLEEVIYRGRIDNSYAAVGSRRRVVTEKDLREVLDAVLKNKPIVEKQKQAIGCFINLEELKL